MILDRLDIDADSFRVGTGWEIKPEGACQGDVCVPLAGAAGPAFDLNAVAARLGMALVPDDEHELWALGPASLNGHALVSAIAPDVVLSDLDGNDFHLASLRGQKVVLVAWAPY